VEPIVTFLTCNSVHVGLLLAYWTDILHVLIYVNILSSILINGSKTDLFVDNMLPCIEKEVHSQEDNLSEINNKILISLTSENIRKQDNIDIGSSGFA
jgi:hypothetical protein